MQFVLIFSPSLRGLEALPSASPFSPSFLFSPGSFFLSPLNSFPSNLPFHFLPFLLLLPFLPFFLSFHLPSFLFRPLSFSIPPGALDSSDAKALKETVSALSRANVDPGKLDRLFEAVYAAMEYVGHGRATQKKKEMKERKERTQKKKCSERGGV